MAPDQHSLPCNCKIHAAIVQGVANRDIKLENTLLLQGTPPVIKLCDFGYSKVRLISTPYPIR